VLKIDSVTRSRKEIRWDFQEYSRREFMSRTDEYIPEKYWEVRLSKDYSLAGVGYLGFSLQYNNWLYKARRHVLRELVKGKNINCRAKKVLALGVGTGFYISFWEQLGVQSFTGIDITAKAVEELRTRYPDYRFMKADISDKGFALNETFDIITLFDVLFHVVDEDKFEQAIKNLKKLCHEGTIILIMDHFLKEYKPAWRYENERTLERYEKVLSANSIEIEDMRPIFYLMNRPVDIERISSKLAQSFIKIMWWTNGKMERLSSKLGGLGRCISYLRALTLYYLDRFILKFTSVGPGAKLMVAKLKPRDQFLSYS